MKNNIFNLRTVLFLCIIVTMFNACDKDDNVTYEKTRLFRPVLNEDLFAEGNNIIVNMGKLKGAVAYTIEVSRDTFQTIEYTVPADTNYVELAENNLGEELFWNTLYQVRATAHEASTEFDSKISDLGNVRTERFPTILNIPASYDVIDVAARVSWTPLGEAVTGMQVFSATDLKLKTPLFPEAPVTSEENLAGEAFVTGLEPETEYQIAIYSGTTLRGWVNYTTKVADIDPNGANVINLSDSEDRGAVSSALASAPDESIILVKRGIEYDAPSGGVDKSFTIRAAYGFGKQQARLLFAGNFDLVSGANIDHLRFVDLELRGTDWTGKYVINASKPGTLNEFSFDGCYVTNFRGIGRIKTDGVTINNYLINNTIVDSINGYGVFAVDKAGSQLNNFKFTNSTFNHVIYFLVSKNNSESIIIEDCTIANAPQNGRQLFRWRQSGQDNVTNGVTISNTIFGHGWGKPDDEEFAIKGFQGFGETTFSVNNTFTVTNFSFASEEIGELVIGNAGSSQETLWVDAENNDFNIQDSGFLGKFSSGDPRWRVKL